MPSSELDRKLRENEGRRLWPDLRRSLVTAIGSEVTDDRLSLAATNILRDAFISRLRSGQDMVTVADTPSLDEVLRALDGARQRTAMLDVILLHHLERSVGALRIPSKLVLASPQKLLHVLKGDLFVTTETAEDGLALSAVTRHMNRTEDRTEYSLALWGRFVA